MRKRYSQEFKETLIAFYHSGQSVAQLSKEYGVAPDAIEDIKNVKILLDQQKKKHTDHSFVKN